MILNRKFLELDTLPTNIEGLEKEIKKNTEGKHLSEQTFETFKFLLSYGFELQEVIEHLNEKVLEFEMKILKEEEFSKQEYFAYKMLQYKYNDRYFKNEMKKKEIINLKGRE